MKFRKAASLMLARKLSSRLSQRDIAEVFEVVEEALDDIAPAVNPAAQVQPPGPALIGLILAQASRWSMMASLPASSDQHLAQRRRDQIDDYHCQHNDQ